MRTLVLDLLPLPGLDRLTDQQARGATCVWDGTTLTADTAMDLGERPAGDGTTLFPRGCRKCVLTQAMQTLHLHTQSCEQCTDDYRGCDIGQGLVRLTREARR